MFALPCGDLSCGPSPTPSAYGFQSALEPGHPAQPLACRLPSEPAALSVFSSAPLAPALRPPPSAHLTMSHSGENVYNGLPEASQEIATSFLGPPYVG